jgi:hypothetical protein
MSVILRQVSPSHMSSISLFRMYLLIWKVTPSEEGIQQVRQLYANPLHPVFEFVPPLFDNTMRLFMDSLGSPVINRGSFWPTFVELLRMVRDAEYEEVWGAAMAQMELAERMIGDTGGLEDAREELGLDEAGRPAQAGRLNIGAIAFPNDPPAMEEDGEDDGDEIEPEGESPLQRAYADDEGRIWVAELDLDYM